jgi:hypothetical protein
MVVTTGRKGEILNKKYKISVRQRRIPGVILYTIVTIANNNILYS